MNKLSYILPVLLLISATLTGQTSLGPGDLAFTMINTDADDAFAFVLLKDVTAGTNFDITDREYKSGSLNTGEGTIRITFSLAATCGSEFVFVSTNNDSNYSGSRVTGTGSATASILDGSMTLAGSGDGLIAFQGGTFITILQKCGGPFGDPDSQCSDLPPGLTEGQNALSFVSSIPGGDGEPDNIKYDCSPTTGTSSQISAFAATNSNWLENNDIPFSYGGGCGFTCQAACTDPSISSLTPAPNNACPGTPVTLTINGSLGDAAEWQLREGSCNGTVLNTTTGGSFTITPSSTTTYFVTATDCNSGQVCSSVAVTRSINGADAGADQLLVNTPTTLAANGPTPGNGMWTVISGDGNGAFGDATSPSSSFSGTAGQSYTLRWSISGGGCPTTTDDVEVSFLGATTDLAAGDLAFTGYNSDAPDEWSFVLLREINAGTAIYFTDNGWLSTGEFRTGEGAVVLIFNRHYPCGSSIYVTRDNSTSAYRALDATGAIAASVAPTDQTGNVVPNIANAGDQLFAYQGTLANPTLLAGIHVGSAWSNTPDNKFSAQPPALTGNNTSVNISAAVQNAKYNCAVTGGLPLAIRTGINTAANWTTSNTLLPLTPDCGFVCGTCEEPTITSVTASVDPVCQGTPVTLTVSGSLNDAEQWAVYETNCGVDLVTTSTNNTLTFSPDVSRTYYVAGINGCVATPNCTLVPITVTGNEADVPQDLIVTAEGATSATIQPFPPTDGQVATLEFLTGDGAGTISGPTGTNVWTINGTSGQSYTLRYSHGGSTCPTTSDEFAVAFALNSELALGDLAFTGINTSAPDGFSFVALTDITAGTTINFTERGWDDGFHTAEGTMELTLTSSLSCGTSVYLQAGATTEIVDWRAMLGGGTQSAGTLTQVGGTTGFALNSNGDQVFAFQDSDPTAVDQSGFIAGIHTACNGCGVDTWDAVITTGDSNDSAKPSVFETGDANYAVNFPASPNNAQFDCANAVAGTPSAQRDALTDATNWSESAVTFDLSVACAPGCIDPPTAVCQDITVQIDADGNPVFTAADLDGGSAGENMPFTFSTDIVPSCSDVSNPAAPVAIVLTVTNSGGASANCTSQVTVEDNVAPTFECTNISVELDANGEYFISNDDVLNRMVQNWSDNCAAAPVNFGSGNRTVTCNNTVNGTFAYFFGAQDGNGQEMTCTVIVTVTDPTLACDDAPIAVCLPTAVVEVDANGNIDASSLDNGSTDDNTAPGDLVFSIDGNVLDCDDVDMPVQTVTLVVTDNVGQSNTCNSQVTVEDNLAPVVTCQNVAFNLDANGSFTLFRNIVLGDILTSFTDNCATSSVSEGISQSTFGCNDIGVNAESFFFRDRPLGPTSREDRCNVLLQINDPLGVCPGNVTANCTDFAAGPNPDGTYTLDANSMDNGSTADRGLYTLVFDPATDRQESLTQDCTFNGTGSGQSFTAGQDGVVQTIRVRSATSVSTNLHLYAGNNGSGTAGSVGTPLYSQAVELFASPSGAFTEMLLTTPFPVSAGSEYTFVLEGATTIYYACAGDAYTGGQTMVNYVQWIGGITEDYTFQVDIIGPTTQEFSSDGDYPVSVYAVDNQGNVSTVCNATFTLDQSLPVEWFSFGANAGAKTVDLQWETSAEPDNAGFHVERSTTGSDWYTIGQVPARTGPDQRYAFEDEAPLQGTSYYRLRQTDFDGQVSYSPVETVAFYGTDRVVISPNPATNEVTIQLPEGAELLGLLDVTGRMTGVRFDGANGQLRTDVSGLPAGIYFLRVRLADGKLSARRLVVR